MIVDMGVTITPQIANCLYTGIATDTGCFKFASTTPRTHMAAARVMEAGADVEKLNARLFESRSHARITAERMAMESLEYYFNDLCAVICLTWDQIESSGVAGAELEDLTSLPRSIEGVEVGLTYRQQRDGSFRISVRTSGSIDACNIARRLGGGGHTRAAGCEISGNLDNAKHAVLEEVRRSCSAAACWIRTLVEGQLHHNAQHTGMRHMPVNLQDGTVCLPPQGWHRSWVLLPNAAQ